MPASTESIITMADQERGTLAVQTQTEHGLELKNEGGTSYIEGFAATTHKDQANDVFTAEALEEMAQKIRNSSDQTVDAVFPHFEGMDESEIGNINHNNNPAAQKMFGTDTRTVSIFKTVDAETVPLEDGETALKIRGEMLPLPDDVEEAVKAHIKQGALHSFSIEFSPQNVNFEMRDGEAIRTILSAVPQGTALTGRPLNEKASVTDAELKNIMSKHGKEDKDEYKGMHEYKQEMVQGDVFETEEEAMNRAEEMGLDGVHSHERGGEMVFMPGATHEAYMSAENEENDVKTSEESNMGEESEDHSDEQTEENDSQTEEEVKNDPELKNEDQQPEEDVESEESEEGVEDDGEEESELKNDVSELKSMFKDIKEENEQLREENSELKSKVEDLKTMDSIKTEIADIKNMVESGDYDTEGDRPIVDQDEQREVKNMQDEDKAQWKREVDQLGMDEDDLKSDFGNTGMTEAESIADLHGVKVEEVLEYAK